MRRAEYWVRWLVLIVFPAMLAAQGGTIRGRVTDAQGAPLVRAAVALEGTGFRTVTDQAGAYQITGVPAGAYTLRARLIGYATAMTQVTVRDNETAAHDVRLEAVAIGLAPVDVVVGSRAAHTAADELAVIEFDENGERVGEPITRAAA